MLGLGIGLEGKVLLLYKASRAYIIISATCTQGTQDSLGNMNGMTFGMRAEPSTSNFKDR